MRCGSATAWRQSTPNHGANHLLEEWPMANARVNPVPLSTPAAGKSELVVVAKPSAGLRAFAAGVESVSGADTTSLASLLNAHGAAMRPLFGLSEDRVRAHQEAIAAPAAAIGAPAPTEPAPDLSLFYRVAVDETRAQQLAADLLAHELVDAAYIKPAGEPPMPLE